MELYSFSPHIRYPFPAPAGPAGPKDVALLDIDLRRVAQVDEQKTRFQILPVQIGHDGGQPFEFVFIAVEAQLQAETRVGEQGEPEGLVSVDLRHVADGGTILDPCQIVQQGEGFLHQRLIGFPSRTQPVRTGRSDSSPGSSFLKGVPSPSSR